jgi:hypothetical protein
MTPSLANFLSSLVAGTLVLAEELRNGPNAKQ